VNALTSWFTEPVPKGRIAAFRTLIYLFVAGDLVFFTTWAREHAGVPGSLYRPLLIGRLLPLPTPTHGLVTALFWVLLVLALAAATGRAPRLLGWAVFALYLEWMIIAMSYGKVDHDRFDLLVALAVLPVAGAARHGEATRTERGGWALRVTQVAVVSTYFLSTWAKFRFGGLGWLTSAVMTRAVLRRGTVFAMWSTHVPHLLQVAQFLIVAFELTTPLVFILVGWRRYAHVAAMYAFHVMVFVAVTISFVPHLFAMTSFLPLERVRPVLLLRRLVGRLARRPEPAPTG
jgi:hypothetical protein